MLQQRVWATVSALLAARAPNLAVANCVPAKTCKAYPGGEDWPPIQTWNQLNDTVGGRLIKPIPPGGICHAGEPNYDKKMCTAFAKNNWTSYEWTIHNPVAVMWQEFTNSTCLPDPSAPCSPEGYPAFVVNATTAAHVKAGVDFARKTNIRLVVKSTGHDYLGRSVAPSALSIWTHYMNDITYHIREFKLAGSGKAIPCDAVTVGGGTEMHQIYAATGLHNHTVVGGASGTVSVSGYTTGGGHSVLGPRYGLAADNVLEVQMVTPTGELITANEDQHCDLFWATRGGGGSTFGVITAITLKAYPSPKIQSVDLGVTTTADAPFRYDLFTYLLSEMPYLVESGLSGFNFIIPKTPNPSPGPGLPKQIATMSSGLILQDPDGPEAAQKIFKPINDTLQSRWKGAAVLTLNVTSYDSFQDWFEANDDNETSAGAGFNLYIVSRLLSKETLTGDEASLKEAVKVALDSLVNLQAFMVGGKGVHNAEPRGGSDAVNPAWRKAYIHSLSPIGFAPLNATAEEDARKTAVAGFQPLRDLTPDSGAYLNEAYPYEKDWQHTFWGDNYERLLAIKRAADPEDVLWCEPCVGNERWREQADGQLCKVE